MAAHQNVQDCLTRLRKTVDTSVAGVTSLTAGNSTFDSKELDELLRAAKASGQEVVITAGSVRIRPKDSTL